MLGRVAGLALVMVSSAGFEEPRRFASEQQQAAAEQIMLVLRGVANAEYPHGVLDDEVAVEYARRIGFRGEVLDVPADYGPNSTQVSMALVRIRRDGSITAIYGFSGGGYNTRVIWQQLSVSERQRVRKVIVVGSPGVDESQFAGAPDMVIKLDPPEGHMAGPKALLESLDR
jgi:hypothetical protein